MAKSSLFDFERKLWSKISRLSSFVNNPKTVKIKSAIKSFLGRTDQKYIKLELCSLCNARCAWCWMYYKSVNKNMGIIEYDNFKNFLDLNTKYLVKNDIRIIPYFNGESLLHPQVLQMLEEIGNAGIKMSSLHTNLSINVDIDKLMSLPIMGFVINMGGITKEVHEKVMKGSNFDLVVSNLKKMIEINKNLVFIKINPTKDNVHQLKDVKKFMASLGGIPENTTISTTGLAVPMLASTEEKEEFLEKVVSDEVKDLLRFTYSIDNENIKIEPKDKDKKCYFLMDSITYDGRVTICPHDQIGKIDLGNAFEIPLEEIRKSKKYKEVHALAKSKQMAYCKDCN